MSNPTRVDWLRVKRIFRYLKGSKQLKLVFRKGVSDLICYTDASFASELDRRSLGGFANKMNGAALAWKSKKQHCVTTNTMEAEYYSLSEAIKEVIWFNKLNADFNQELKEIIVYEDNQSTIRFASDNIVNARSKHIDIRYHFARENVLEKCIAVQTRWLLIFSQSLYQKKFFNVKCSVFVCNSHMESLLVQF